MTSDECREEFEARGRLNFDITRREDGHYKERDTECAWVGFRSAWKPSEMGFDPKTEGALEKYLRFVAVELGKPLVAQSFPGPEAHKLTPEEYAFEIGRVEIGIALGIIKSEIYISRRLGSMQRLNKCT